MGPGGQIPGVRVRCRRVVVFGTSVFFGHQATPTKDGGARGEAGKRRGCDRASVEGRERSAPEKHLDSGTCGETHVPGGRPWNGPSPPPASRIKGDSSLRLPGSKAASPTYRCKRRPGRMGGWLKRRFKEAIGGHTKPAQPPPTRRADASRLYWRRVATPYRPSKCNRCSSMCRGT